MHTPITGREPSLSAHTRYRGYRRLSPRRLGTILNLLSPDAISLDAAAVMLRSDQFFMRYNAARLLGERGDRDARLIMADVLATGNVPSRASAARQLGRFSWYAAEPLLRQALADEDERVREGAVYALCDLRELNAYQLLVEVLQDDTDTIRAAAVWGLRNCQDSAAVPVLEAALLADDPEVRGKALEALSANDTPEAVPVVRRVLREDAHSDVVYNATLSLVELREDDSIPELADLIRETRGARRESILRGFFHATNYLHVELAEHPAVDALLEALTGAIQDEFASVRIAAAWILAWMRHARAPVLLGDLYHGEADSGAKARILTVAVALMSEIGDDLLSDALRSDDLVLREMGDHIQQNRAAGVVVQYDETDSAAAPLEKSEWIT